MRHPRLYRALSGRYSGGSCRLASERGPSPSTIHLALLGEVAELPKGQHEGSRRPRCVLLRLAADEGRATRSLGGGHDALNVILCV